MKLPVDGKSGPQPKNPPPRWLRMFPGQRVSPALLVVGAALGAIVVGLLIWLCKPVENEPADVFPSVADSPSATQTNASVDMSHSPLTVKSYPPAADPTGAIQAEEAIHLIGQERTVQMTVNETGGRVHLYLYASANRADGTFVAQIDRSLVAQMSPKTVAGLKPQYLHKRLRVQGLITLRSFDDGLNRPCIVVTELSQIDLETP